MFPARATSGEVGEALPWKLKIRDWRWAHRLMGAPKPFGDDRSFSGSRSWAGWAEGGSGRGASWAVGKPVDTVVNYGPLPASRALAVEVC